MINMNNQSANSKKVLRVIIILIIILAGLVFLRAKRSVPKSGQVGEKGQEVTTTSPIPTAGISNNSMFLVASPETIQVGSDIKIAVAFYAPGVILSGADVILKYDPVFLKASQDLDLGQYFSSYPLKTIDNTKGNIRLTAFGGKSGPNSSAQVIFSVNLKAKKTGRTEIKLDYLSGSTNRSTLVEKGTSKNILSGVSNAVVEIRP